MGHEHNDYYICHGLKGIPVLELLRIVVDYIATYKREIVIIDFNHFYGMNDNDHIELTQLIAKQLPPHLLWSYMEVGLTLNEAFTKVR